MSTPGLVRTVSTVVSLVWMAVLFASGIELPTLGKQLIAYLPTFLVLLAVAFDLWIWKIPVLGRLHRRPRIYGTWETTITPHPGSHIPEGGTRVPIQGTTTVEQTFWTLSVIMKTAESESISRAESIAADGGSKTRKVMTYTYMNTPQLAVRDRSPIHVGAANLTIEGLHPRSMNGTYWTDRLTIGDLALTRSPQSPSTVDLGRP